jgi:Methyltransferase domain
MTNTIMTMTDHDPVGSVDPALHLPNPRDARRIKYINKRKQPQVIWMLGLIQKTLNGMNQQRVLQLVEIGGGRGDLANSVAAYFTRLTNTRVHITVMDNNESSLEAGRCAATTAGLDSCMTFLLCDLNDATEVATPLPTITTSFDLVFGSHCCGGLAEAAVELALKYRASFCISTCCFRSNCHRTSLTHLAGVYQGDVDLISTLAVMVSSQGQHRAMRALNAMRLVTAE